jgi:hypothetical protein
MNLGRTTGCLAESLPADVVRDHDQPVMGLGRALAALERTVGVHERRLRDVLRIRGVPGDRERIPVDVSDMRPVKALEDAVRMPMA